MSEILTYRNVFPASQILTQTYPGYITLVPAPGANRIIWPTRAALVVYAYKTRPFGAKLQMGWYPDRLNDLVADMTASASKISALPVPVPGVSFVLSEFINKAFVLNAYDGALLNGQLGANALAAGGVDYAVNDTGTIDPSATHSNGDATYVVTARNAATHAVTAYRITNPGTGWFYADLPITADTDASGTGTGFQVLVSSVLQGDGELYLDFDYEIITVPYPVN